jgi:hypothetical protein
MDVNATVGTGSPDTTGYILAVFGILSPFYGYDISITPDFDNQIYEGSIYIKGRVTLFVVGFYLARIYFDKQMQKFIEEQCMLLQTLNIQQIICKLQQTFS